MALSPRLELRQSQTLVMTPQLQQAIKLLQLNNLDLSAYVETQLLENPLLERAGEERREDGDSPPEAAAETAETGAVEALAGEGVPSAEASEALDAPYEALYDGDDGPDRATGLEFSSFAAGGGEAFNLENVAGGEKSLREHLAEQLSATLMSPGERLIAGALIDMVDEAGYLREEPDELAARLGCSRQDIDVVLDVLRGFEPTGVFAASLGECLARQLAERDRLDPMMATFLDHLDLLTQGRHEELMRICGADAEDFAGMMEELRRLDPKPGLAFGGGAAAPVVPDVFVSRGPDGGWRVELNSETLPRVLVNTRYYAEIGRNARNKREKNFVTDCFNAANWLVKSLDQRANTILKVATEIVRLQDAFLNEGIQHLRPLNLKTVAEEISMHESTVSRVTANKYMATPRGVFEMKYFFTSAIASAEGNEAHSAEAVRHRIKALIDAEDPKKILSDDKIAEILRKEDIDIARRTVAKYREAMNIPSSVQRRRLKRMKAG